MTPLLTLFSSAPGLPGPYLRENIAGYEPLEAYGCSKPRILMVMGDLDQALPSNSICLSHLEVGTIAFNYCPAPPPWRLRPTQSPLIEDHLLSPSSLDVTQRTHKVCIDIIKTMCDLVVVVVSDVGGEDGLRQILYLWLETVLAEQNRSLKHLLVVSREQLDPERFMFNLTTTLLARLKASDTMPRSFHDITTLIKSTFRFTWYHGCEREEIRAKILEYASKTPGRIPAFRVVRLLRQQFRSMGVSRRSSTQDSSSAGNSVVVNENILAFWKATSNLNVDRCWAVASALHLELKTNECESLEELFGPILKRCQRNIDDPFFLQNVWNYIKALAMVSGTPGPSDWQRHCEVMRLYSPRQGPALGTWCTLCLLRPTTVDMDCTHNLCARCFSTDKHSARRNTVICPLCRQQVSYRGFVPPTAGLRVLTLSGHEPVKLWESLKALQSSVGLTGHSLRWYFDRIIARDIGIYFLITLFIEGWTLAEVRHHIPRLKKPRFSKSRVWMGKKLSWPISILHLGNEKHEFSNTVEVSKKVDFALLLNSSDLRASLLGQTSQMYAALFYIQVLSFPSYYNSWHCDVSVRCRVPPGPALMDLLFRMKHNGAVFEHRGDSANYATSEVYDPDKIDTSQAFESYYQVLSLVCFGEESQLDINLRLRDGRFPVSKCPYKLGDLVSDSQSGHCGWIPSFGTESALELQTCNLIEQMNQLLV